MPELQLIVGLGNPGISYKNTRHNLGSIWVQRLSAHYGVPFKSNHKLQADLGNLHAHLMMIIPQQYMNNSGITVKQVVDYYKINPNNILVVHDDLDLPVGTIRPKIFGGHGGHNGVKNIIEQLHTNCFNRLRIGIGRPTNSEKIVNYVLSKISQADWLVINQSIEHSILIIDRLLSLNNYIINWQQLINNLNIRGAP